MTCWPAKFLPLYVFLLSITFCVATHYPIRPRIPGLAFGLTPGYGTAAIWLKDGTSVSVAQIQGSPAYQALMRKNTNPKRAQNSTFCRLFSPALHLLPSALGLHSDICRDADVDIMKAMLGTLNTAVESYLGTNICFASLVVDDPKGYEAIVAQEALEALGLRQVLGIVSAANSEAHAHMPDPVPEFDEEPWIVLAVDYSEHWFNVSLHTIEEGGIVDPVEETVRSAWIGEDNQMDAFGDALRHLLANPPPGINLSQQIHHLVVYGNAKNDVLELLPTILDADLVRDAYISTSAFDSVVKDAYWAHVLMDEVGFEIRESKSAAFGCRWRSKLYSKSRDEL